MDKKVAKSCKILYMCEKFHKQLVGLLGSYCNWFCCLIGTFANSSLRGVASKTTKQWREARDKR